MASLLKLWKSFSYLGVVIVARGGAVDSVTISIRRRLNAFRDLVSLLASRDFPLGTKADYVPCVYVARPGQLKRNI